MGIKKKTNNELCSKFRKLSQMNKPLLAAQDVKQQTKRLRDKRKLTSGVQTLQSSCPPTCSRSCRRLAWSLVMQLHFKLPKRQEASHSWSAEVHVGRTAENWNDLVTFKDRTGALREGVGLKASPPKKKKKNQKVLLLVMAVCCTSCSGH